MECEYLPAQLDSNQTGNIYWSQISSPEVEQIEQKIWYYEVIIFVSNDRRNKFR